MKSIIYIFAAILSCIVISQKLIGSVNAYTCQSNGITCCPNACLTGGGSACNCGYSSPGNCPGSSAGSCGGSAQCASGSTIIEDQSANPKCSWVCTTGDTSVWACGTGGCPSNQAYTCNCVSQNNWSCSCQNNAACVQPTNTPTPIVGCGTCSDNGQCGNSCGGACGWCQNGGAACRFGNNCPVTPPATPVPSDPVAYGYQDPPDNASCTLNGWACDPSKFGQSLNIHVYENVNQIFVKGFPANTIPDPGVTAACGGVAANYRFNFTPLPDTYRDGLAHSLTAYALGINASGAENGNNPSLGSNPQSITCAYRIGGYVRDSSTGAGIGNVQIQVWNATKGTQATPTTDGNGYWNSTIVSRGDWYSITPQASAPAGYLLPAKAWATWPAGDMRWTWNGVSADTAQNAGSYQGQQAGNSDCGGNSPIGRERCSFKYDPCVPLAAPTLAVTQPTQCSSTVSLSWNTITGNTGYRIYKNGVFLKDVAANSTSTTDTATCDVSTNYSISTRNFCGTQGSQGSQIPSGIIYCTPTGSITAPTAVSPSYGQISLTWSGSGLSLRKAPAPGTWISDVSPGIDSAVTCPVTNQYYLRKWSGPSCYLDSPTTSASCLPNPQYFLTSGGDVTAVNGAINNNPVPTPATLANLGGVIVGNAINWSWVTDFKASTSVSTSLVSNYAFNTLYDHAKAKAGALMPDLSSTTTDVNFLNTNTNCTLVDNVCYLHFTGSSLQINGGATAINRNVVVFYDNATGDVTINGNISVTAKSFVVVSKRDIYVDSGTGTAGDPRSHGDNLQGIYIAAGTFYDKNGNAESGTLRVNGSVVGLGGVSMTRTTGTSTYPRDYFVFNPGYVLNLPSGLKVGNRLFQELTP